jgi:hypothetical protein
MTGGTARIVAGLVSLALTMTGGSLAAQASAYVPLDHPLLPLFEHLVTRGDIDDPSPMVRPFRQHEALRVLDLADTIGHPRLAAQLQVLRAAFDTLPADASWALAPRAGAQLYTSPRRDLERATDDPGAAPYVELGAMARFGALVVSTRPAIEPRLTDDPEWTGRRNLDVTGRMVEGYLSAQWRWVQLFYGQVERNWGPPGLAGVALSGVGYGRPEFGIALGTDKVRLTALASTLQSTTDTNGQVYRRFFFAHRIDARLSRRLRLGLWETVVVAGVDREFDGRFRNPVSLLLLANQYGLGDRENNIMVGLDADWRVARPVRLNAQLAIDDLQYKNRGGANRYPDRYAFTLAASGPLAGSAGWRGYYTQVSSLAFRTFDPAQDFLDGGVGIGRTYDDYDQFGLTVSVPVGPRWLVTPELGLIRQGEGRIQAPVPPGFTTEAGDTPQLFIGTVERRYRAAIGASGQHRAVAVNGLVGVERRANADNIEGRNRTDLVGRLTITVGWSRRGSLE